MSIGLEYATVSAVTSAVWGLVYGRLRWRAGETAELRQVLVEVRDVMQTVVAGGGASTDLFLRGAGLGLDDRVQDLVPRLRDRKLRREVEEVGRCLRTAWAASSPRGLRFRGELVQGPEDVERMKMATRQVEASRAGLEAVGRALARINRLQRPLVSPS